MAWTTPRTWVTGEVVSAATMNSHVRDNLDWLRQGHGCRAYKSATQTVAVGTTPVISFNSESYDRDAIHDNATNNSRFTVPVGMGGLWEFHLNLSVDADTSHHNARWVASVRKNAAGSNTGGTQVGKWSRPGHANVQDESFSDVVDLVAGDYLEAFFQSDGEARDLASGTDGTSFVMLYNGT